MKIIIFNPNSETLQAEFLSDLAFVPQRARISAGTYISPAQYRIILSSILLGNYSTPSYQLTDP
jgi:hypothetical protein